jgi:hypothetical protein
MPWWLLPNAVMQSVDWLLAHDDEPKGRVRTKPLQASPFSP